MRAALVNDLRLALKALQAVMDEMDIQVSWTAKSGREAVEKCKVDTPDVILMDLVMPELNGAAAIERIMRECPCPILVVTASIGSNLDLVYEAMSHGATDVTLTPRFNFKGELVGGAPLKTKLKRLEVFANPPSLPPPSQEQPQLHKQTDLVAIGSSTGGPAALLSLLRELPDNLPFPIVAVQHIDSRFLEGLVRWLDERINPPVLPTLAHETALARHIYLASEEKHLEMDFRNGFSYKTQEAIEAHCPSIDVFFESLASSELKGSAFLLSGMGQDGARGLLALRHKAWRTYAQEEQSCVVFGMPKAAKEIGATQHMLSPSQMGKTIKALAQRLPVSPYSLP